MEKDREEQMSYGHNDNATSNATTPCPACQGAGEVSSLRQLYIHNTARFNCICGHWIILTPFKDTVECGKCGETWRWVVLPDSQMEHVQQCQHKGMGMSPEQTEEVRNKLNLMIQALNEMSADVTRIIANTNIPY